MKIKKKIRTVILPFNELGNKMNSVVSFPVLFFRFKLFAGKYS